MRIDLGAPRIAMLLVSTLLAAACSDDSSPRPDPIGGRIQQEGGVEAGVDPNLAFTSLPSMLLGPTLAALIGLRVRRRRLPSAEADRQRQMDEGRHLRG